VTQSRAQLRSQRLRLINHQGDALRLGMNWTDGAVRGPCIGHVAPEALDDGPIAVVEDGDLISIDVARRRLDIVGVAGETRKPEEIDEVLTERRRIWRPPRPRHETGILSLYSRVGRAAADGASIT
jgi:dihydroxy-acid dehydratase